MKILFFRIFLVLVAIPSLSFATASKRMTTIDKEKETVTYYSAVKLLRSRALRENQKIGTVFFGPHQTIWQKIKKDLIDKELRRKAFIKDGELVVFHEVLEKLDAQVATRTKELVQAQGKKQDRMISVGYAESRARDMLRRAGYRDTKEVETIMQDIEKAIKQTFGKSTRIAFSKLEELILASIKKNKEKQKHYGNKDLSRLGAEVKILKAIKKKKLSTAQEISATQLMIDALSKQKAHRFSSEEINTLIEKTFKDLESKEQKTSKNKKIKKKRGKAFGRGRWGNEKHPSQKATSG